MKQLFTFLFFVAGIASFSQNTITLSGTITDEVSASPLELAAVVLKTKDSVYVSDVFTNNNGKFIFLKAHPGKFFIEVSYLGYEKYSSTIIELTSSVVIPQIKLRKNENAVKEVNISATKNALEFKPGKTIYTVGRDQTNTGLNGLEVLRKIPGVFIDNNDNITVRGKSGIRVYIDDRPSSLAVENPAEAIKFFPAGSIESIEVITNPSAKYDAAGAGAIINIKLKKEKKMGINGNFNLGAGSRYEFSGVNKYNAGFNANIRRNKTNVFINSSLRLDERQSYNENNREDAFGFTIKSTSSGVNKSVNGFAKAGIDYFINDKNTFGISYMISSSNYNTRSRALSANNYNSLLFPGTLANSLTDGNFTSHTLNLNYIFKTKHAGEEFSFDVTHSILSRNNLDSINTMYQIIPIYQQNQYSSTLGDVISNSSQVDYTKTLKGDAKMEAGIKNNYTGNKSKFDFFNNEQSNWALDSTRSNKFDYFENVSAAYVQYTNKYKKWDYELGLRGEYTIVNSNLNEVKQNYFNLFPDLQFSKKFEESRELSFSYSKRIDRPPFSELSNAVRYSDKYIGFRGNPKLQPEISNSMEISFQKQFDSNKKFKIGSMGATLFGALNKNDIGRTVVIDTNKVGYVTYTNIKRDWGSGANFYTQYSYQRWYNATISLSYVYNHISDSSKGGVYSFYTQHSFKFLKKHSINVNGYYNSKFIAPQGYIKATYQVNAGYKYVFWKETASLSLNVSDIFKTGKFRYVFDAQGNKINGYFQFESRYAYLTFQYKFNKGWQGDGKKRTKKNTKDNRLDFDNNGGGLGNGK